VNQRILCEVARCLEAQTRAGEPYLKCTLSPGGFANCFQSELFDLLLAARDMKGGPDGKVWVEIKQSDAVGPSGRPWQNIVNVEPEGARADG
jgi:hypothetical protein